jgi:type IV pilus assembly protein PilX
MAPPMVTPRLGLPVVRRSVPRRQRGVVMVVTLISLVILLIGVAAMLRTVDNSALMVGNLAFRRDLTNQGEQAIVLAKTALVSGALAGEANRVADSATAHYSASRLPSAAGSFNGIPAVLLNTSSYSAAGYGTPAPNANSITLYYVIDRQCVGAGAYSISTCEFQPAQADQTMSDHDNKPGGATRPVYRVSIRVTGPRNTEAFFQAIYAD